MVKVCKFDSSKRCYHASCDSIDGMGNVSVCPLLPNSDGRFTPRLSKPVHVAVFSKHNRGGS